MASPAIQIRLPFFYLRFGEPSNPGLNKARASAHRSDLHRGYYKVIRLEDGRPNTTLQPANIAKACCSPPVRE